MPDAHQAREAHRAIDTMPEWLVQWPMIALTGWWDIVFDACRPKGCAHHADDSHEIAVPEPIEREGERSLFA